MSVLFAMAIAVSVAPDRYAEAQEPAVSVTITAAPSTSLHEPIVAKIGLYNSSRLPVQVDTGWNRVGSFVFELTGPDGSRKAGRPHPTWDGGTGLIGRLVIRPGELFSEPLLLNEWLDFSRLGNYTVTVRFDGSIQGAPAAPVAADRTASISLTVLPRDQQRLKDVGETLLQQAIGTRGESQIRAVTSLALMQDAVSVPYLVEVIENHVLLAQALRALARTPGPEARQALTTLTSSADLQVAAAAASELRFAEAR